MVFYIIIILAFIPIFIAFPTRVIGKKNVIKKGRMILCCNHQSNNDLLILGTRLPRRFKYMAKEPLFKRKFFAWILRELGAYPVKNTTTDIVAIKTTLTHLKNEEAVCIFPEGRRIKTSDSNELKNGVIIFALKTKSPIVPCCIIKKPRPFTFNTLIVGEPFNLSEMEKFKDKKVDKDLIEAGKKILSKKIIGLKNDYENKKKNKKNKKNKKKNIEGEK